MTKAHPGYITSGRFGTPVLRYQIECWVEEKPSPRPEYVPQRIHRIVHHIDELWEVISDYVRFSIVEIKLVVESSPELLALILVSNKGDLYPEAETRAAFNLALETSRTNNPSPWTGGMVVVYDPKKGIGYDDHEPEVLEFWVAFHKYLNEDEVFSTWVEAAARS